MAALQVPMTEPGLEDKSPIWTKSLLRFAEDEDTSKLYSRMKGRIEEITLLNVDSWDTWLNNEPKESSNTWFRRCKAYLPPLKTIEKIAIGVSKLDPYQIAPWVTTGIFVAVELCFECVDPSARDKAMSMILKTNLLISKWVDGEVDLERMKMRSKLPNIENIAKQLETLYFDSLTLICKIYESGEKRGSRFMASLVSEPAEWDQLYQKLNERSSACSESKSQVELELKRVEANIVVLDWIRNRSEDPEPTHQTVKETTHIDDLKLEAGKWFLETSEFSSWIDGVRRNETQKRVFWLRGSMGTGKTTLMCRVISHFEEFPISGVRFVRYYCYGSRTAKDSKAPKYETVLRSLCYRLAWNSDGSIAKPATDLYDKSKGVSDVSLTEKKTWQPLLENLINSTKKPTVVVIDALDECKTQDDYTKLLKFLNELLSNCPRLYCLVSSQLHIHTDYFQDSVQTFNAVQPRAEIDMKRFIETQIDSKKDDVDWGKSIFFKDEHLRHELELGLYDTAGGMFRWVEIWLGAFFPKNKKIVRRPQYAEELLKELKNFETFGKLPVDEEDNSLDSEKRKALQKAYGILWKINGDDQYEVFQVRVFQVVMGAFVKVTPKMLFDAVRFDPEIPDNYVNLESDEFHGLFCNFLKTNSSGYLDFEHLSAKIFVSEMKDKESDNLLFSKENNHRALADIAVKVIERPDHPIWTAAKIPLVEWGAEARRRIDNAMKSDKASAENMLTQLDFSLKTLYYVARPKFVFGGPKDESLEMKNLAWEFLPPNIDSLSFGTYLYEFWLEHCQIFHDEGQFIQQMSNLFRGERPGFEAWSLIQASNTSNTDILSRVARPSGTIISPSPLLCMVQFNFSPFSHTVGPLLTLLPEFEDITARSLTRKTVLHIASKAGNHAMLEDLLKFGHVDRSKGSLFLQDRPFRNFLLYEKDQWGRNALHYASTDDIVKTLLKYEALLERKPFPPAVGDSRDSKLLSWKDQDDRTPIVTIVANCSDELLQWVFERYRYTREELLILNYQINHDKLAELLRMGYGI